MKSIRTILVDDERIGRSRLRRMLEKESDIDIVGECADGASAIRAVRQHTPDLLLLDINMPDMDGFGVLEALQDDYQPQVIFITAYDQYAVRAFDACALDYLLKPASPERLSKALSRARERLSAPQPPHTPAPAVSQAPRFTVRSGGRITFVASGEIDWVEGAGNYAILHAGPANHMIRETMAAMEEQLGGETFLRVSRSAIVNLRRVKELYASPQGDHAAILVDGQRVHFTRPLREIADRLKLL